MFKPRLSKLTVVTFTIDNLAHREICRFAKKIVKSNTVYLPLLRHITCPQPQKQQTCIRNYWFNRTDLTSRLTAGLVTGTASGL